MAIDLVLKDIQDIHVRENFFRLQNFLNGQVLFEGDFKLFDITIPGKFDNFRVDHGLTFIPSDIIPLFADGDYNYFFRYDQFTRESIFITTSGPARVRFLAGKLKDRASLSDLAKASIFETVAPGDIILPSPGFIFAAIDDKFPGFWLTNESIPTNVVGLPVLFANSRVIQAAVGTELETDYEIGIFQHEGQGIGLTQLGAFNITSGGPKRIPLDLSIDFSSPNVQLACRLLAGNTRNLKVSLVLKGRVL